MSIISKEDLSCIAVYNAISYLRSGLFLYLDDELVCSPETASPELINNLSNTYGLPNLVITAERANYLFGENKFVGILEIVKPGIDAMLKLCTLSQTPLTTHNYSIMDATTAACSSVTLAKIAELLPHLLIFKRGSHIIPSIVSISSEEVQQYQENYIHSFTRVLTTKLNLQDAEKSEILTFRSNYGGKEHYAIIIGDVSTESTPTIRLHSSCYTGDLLESLACDCGSQLRNSISYMSKTGGGIVLYITQEGRGIGLANKLRAYNLQRSGLDTAEANEALGFKQDERDFSVAAEMLKQLGISNVNILSNNSAKVRALESCGINIEKVVPHIGHINVHNQKYLETKVNKMGHAINLQQKNPE